MDGREEINCIVSFNTGAKRLTVLITTRDKNANEKIFMRKS